MDRSQTTRGMRMPLGRREFLKKSGAVAGARLAAAALAGVGSPSFAGAAPVAAAVRRAAMQGATGTLTFGAGTDVDELDPRTIDTQEGYIACANIYDTLVLYDYGATTLRP